MSWNNWIPATQERNIGNSVKYRLHKHWGMNVWAGEGLFVNNGDRSGCLTNYSISGGLIDKNCPVCPTCPKPIIVLQRIYWKRKKQISAVLNYPNGLSSSNEYFWEIYPAKDGDIERFTDEKEMEQRIKQLLK